MRSFLPLFLWLALPVVAQGVDTSSAPSTALSSTPPDAPVPQSQLKVRDTSTVRAPQVVMINGRPYQPPTQRQIFVDYLRDSYGIPAFARTTVRAVYGQARGLPTQWNFGQRFGSAVAITAINGNVRYGMEELFHEDLRYIPCHGCNAKHKIENTLLAEFTARHDTDGHRFFTLTPTIADFSGPIIAHSIWYPSGFNPFGGVVATRTVFATRVGGHVFREFVWERRHKDAKEEGY
jgi:hypothetical protein